MKKLFIMTMAAVFALGMTACEQGAGGGGQTPEDGESASLQISFTLPAGQGTRAEADDFEPINALEKESTVITADVWVFDANGNAVGKGPYHKLTAATDFVTPAAGQSVWNMNDTKKLETTAGDNMRIWVGVNVPEPSRQAYANEALLLEEIATVENMWNTAGGFTMFSNAEVQDLDPRGTTGVVNEFTVKVNRVVSKIIATRQALTPVLWANSDANPANQLELTYELSHWFVMQYSTSSYVAPHYPVDDWNEAGVHQGNPETYKDALAPYATATANKLAFATTGATTPGNTIDYVALGQGMYIGENASPEALTEKIAQNKGTTYAFISTIVTADAEATWDAETEAIVWANKGTEYGGGNSDIFVVSVKGIDYVTSTLAKAQDIRRGYAEVEAAKLNLTIGQPQNLVQGIVTLDYFLGEYPQFDYVDIYTYHEGYVHFMTWINRIGDNHYDVLRNQFIHLHVSKLNDALGAGGNFPGYPGQDPEDGGDPEIPIDPTEEDENNPDPKIPSDPVDPKPADLQVNIDVNPWTYRWNNVVLGR